MENNFPYIRYFVDGISYMIDGKKTLVIGGAYSVDKYYRLAKFHKDATWTGWFENEQLSGQERELIQSFVEGESYDIVLTHTCPRSWQPTDLFLHGIDQTTVDNSTEDWLDELKNKISWNIFLWGHYHKDRIERPHCEMYFQDIEDLTTIWDRWNKNISFNNFSREKSPYYYFNDNPWTEKINKLK